MTITNVQAEDRGTYRCLASNIINGEPQLVQRDIKLDVKCEFLTFIIYSTYKSHDLPSGMASQMTNNPEKTSFSEKTQKDNFFS